MTGIQFVTGETGCARRYAVHPNRREDSGAGGQSRPLGRRKLKDYKDQWRVRIGDWRVVYIIDDKAKLISVTRIAQRREVYE